MVVRPGRPSVSGIMLSRSERGASAVFVAAAMVVLVAMAAIAIDVGAGFTERRGNQSAADVAVLAGVLDLTNLGECGAGSTDGCDQLLDIAERNLTEQYTLTEWQDIWRTCTDPNKPTGFTPLPAATSNGWTGFNGTGWDGTAYADRIDCISSSSQELRVRIPDQLRDTSFASVIGADQLTTNAEAQAALDIGGLGGVLPFGVLSGDSGETCLVTAPAGQAEPPCDGASTGNFYTLESDTWGPPSSDVTLTDCAGVPGAPELAINVALGIDHILRPYTDWTPPPSRSPYSFTDSSGSTDDNTTRKDECRPVGGVAVADDDNPDTQPRDTVIAGTGADDSVPVLEGLINGQPSDFAGNAPNGGANVTPRLRNTGTCEMANGSSCTTRTIEERVGPTNYTYSDINDVPLWEYLIAEPLDSTHFTCGVVTLNNTTDVDTTEEMDCLLKQFPTSGEGIIFSPRIATNLRFGWTPQFYFSAWGPGNHPQPIETFTQVYLHKIWFKDGGSVVIFEPDDGAGSICIGGGPNCDALDLLQLTAFLIPSGATPTSVSSSFPGGSTFLAEPILTK